MARLGPTSPYLGCYGHDAIRTQTGSMIMHPDYRGAYEALKARIPRIDQAPTKLVQCIARQTRMTIVASIAKAAAATSEYATQFGIWAVQCKPRLPSSHALAAAKIASLDIRRPKKYSAILQRRCYGQWEAAAEPEVKPA